MSAGDSGYHRIRSDIIFGVLTPSGRLKLDSMKEDYGVSVSTLREILNRLASEGFVVAEGQRGFDIAFERTFQQRPVLFDGRAAAVLQGVSEVFVEHDGMGLHEFA